MDNRWDGWQMGGFGVVVPCVFSDRFRGLWAGVYVGASREGSESVSIRWKPKFNREALGHGGRHQVSAFFRADFATALIFSIANVIKL